MRLILLHRGIVEVLDAAYLCAHRTVVSCSTTSRFHGCRDGGRGLGFSRRTPLRSSMEETTMKLTLWILFAILIAPTALLVAIALGPVIIGVLCAVGCGLLVFAIGSLLLGIGTGAQRVGSRLVGHR